MRSHDRMYKIKYIRTHVVGIEKTNEKVVTHVFEEINRKKLNANNNHIFEHCNRNS